MKIVVHRKKGEADRAENKNESIIQKDTYTDKNGAKSELRLVYLMNDAVESFWSLLMPE